MTAQGWQRVWEIYKTALTLPVEGRPAFLQSAGLDDEVAGQVLALLDNRNSSPRRPDEFYPAGDSPIRPGSQLGRYQILGSLGRGGSGEAFAARDLELDRPVALKFLRQEDAAGAEHSTREAKAASALNHPNIVTVFEVIRSPYGVAIVMELVSGEELRSLCGAPQPVERVLRIGEQLAQALAASHAANVVHRDIKPENIMVRADGYIKVLDFGLARRLDAVSISQSAPLTGTLRYMSPEQTLEQRATPASDVFSMGLVLFELAAGSHAYPANSALETMMAISRGEPKSLAEVNPKAPPELTSLIGRMLAKDPLARPTAGEVAKQLTEIENDSKPGHQPPPGARPKRRNVLRWGLAALPAAGLGVIAWRQFGGEETEWPEAIPWPGVGAAVEPALSPDGRTVAYVSLDDFNIYTKTGSHPPVRLTASQKEQGSPTWSPDGKSIAFLAGTGVQRAEIRIIPAEGGPSRRLSEIPVPPVGRRWFPGPALRWSPDASWLGASAAVSQHGPYSLYLYHAETGESRRLTDPLSVEAGDSGLAFSPDGRTLAFSRMLDEYSECHLYVLPLQKDLRPAGPARKIETGKSWNTSPAWTVDGRELVYSTGGLHATRLARISPWIAGAQTKPLAGIGESGWYPTIANPPAGRLLTYIRRINTTSIWRLDFTLRHGVPVSTGQPIKVISATGLNAAPVWAPTGRRFAFVSTRTGYPEVWVSDANGATPEQWTSLQAAEISDVRWLADGRVMFDLLQGGRKVRHAVGASPSKPEPLLGGGMRSGVASPDGKWIHFLRRRSPEVWRIPASGAGEATRVTEDSGYNFQISPDGNTLYYAKTRDGETWIWAVNLWAATVADRIPKPLIRMADSHSPGRHGIYFLPYPETNKVAYYDLATGVVTPFQTPSRIKPGYMIGVSPDETSLLYSENEFDSATLMTVAGFH